MTLEGKGFRITPEKLLLFDPLVQGVYKRAFDVILSELGWPTADVDQAVVGRFQVGGVFLCFVQHRFVLLQEYRGILLLFRL